MWLKGVSHSQLLVAFLVLYYNVMPTSATNMAQLKNQHQTLGQTSTISTQHQHHVATQAHHQLQKQTLLSGGTAAHPVNDINSGASNVVHDSNARHHNTETKALPTTLTSSSTSTLSNLPSPQYDVHDKEMAMEEVLRHFNRGSELNDPYQIVNELKRETNDNTNHEQPPPPSLLAVHPNNMAYPWNLYDSPYAAITEPPPPAGLFSHNFNPFETFPPPVPVTPRFLPIMSYPQPIYVPYPLIMSPDMLYPSYSSLSQMSNGYEDSMSRGASRRPGSSHHSSNFPRNSPIYYMRLPPMPYMFLSNIGIGSRGTPMFPYQSLPTFPSFSSIFHVPINFLANGKPSNIYQMTASPNDLNNPIQFSNIPSSLNMRLPPPPPPNVYRPVLSSHNYFNSQPSPTSSSSNFASYPGSATGPPSPLPTSTTSSSSSLLHQDSKLTSLKHPYFFNGRPEDIYILPNNFNTLFSPENSYY